MMTTCRCGTALLSAARRDGVVTIAGDVVAFRRHTDFVICPGCLSMYAADELQQGRRTPARLMARKLQRELQAAG